VFCVLKLRAVYNRLSEPWFFFKFSAICDVNAFLKLQRVV